MKLGSRFWPVALGLYGAIGGVVSFGGWALGVHRLTDWFQTGISIQPNTCVATMAAGAGLLSLATGRIRAAAALGVIIAFLGASVVFETGTGINLGIDTVFLFGRPWGNTATIAVGRMGIPSAISWVMIGAALLLATLPKKPTVTNIRLHAGSPGAAGVAAVISAMALVGYMFGASALYAIPAATAIAIQTATFVLALSLGTILSVKEYGPSRLIYDEGMAGTMFRRMMPALVLVPLVLGFLRLQGETLGYYDLAFGTAARTVVEMAVLVLFVWLAAGDVNRVEHERRRAEARLVEQDELLRTVTEEAEVGLVIIDRDHRYLYANRSYAEIIRVDPTQVIGRHVREALPDVYEPRIRPKIETAFTGQTVQYELDLPDREQFVSVTYQPVSRNGVVDRLIVAIVDTTQRRMIENALQKTREELELASRRKDEFLMTLAHELRNPLAPIRTAVDILKRASAPEDMTGPRDVIERQVKLMVRLLDDLLDMGRIERDTLTLRKARIDLGTVVRNATEISQPLADRYRQQLAIHVPINMVEVDADTARLEQVVANLLNNACRFTPPEGRIDIFVERDGPDAIIRVRDNGIGIPREDLARIFEMFQQLSVQAQGAQGGLGIGLHLVKRLVEMHGGTVEAQSDGLARGSEFIVRLPALTATATAEAPHTTLPPAAIEPKRILVVDDNVDAATAMAMLLTVVGHEAHVAHTGPEALDAVSALKPDVVLLDLGLPGMDGYEVCRHIRTNMTEHQPLVVALTGWGQESDRQKSRQSGFDHHLVKPVDYEALADLLAKSAR